MKRLHQIGGDAAAKTKLQTSFPNSLIIHRVKTKKIRTVTVVWICDLNSHKILRFYTSVFSVVLVSIEKIYQTLERVFHHISKHLEVRQKYSAERRIFNSLLRVWKFDETLSLVFDILRKTLRIAPFLTKLRHIV